jgi:hypothetical protein
MELEPPPVAARPSTDPVRWLRWMAAGIAALAVVAIGPWSGAEEASPRPFPTTCDPAATRPAPPAGDALQAVTVEVPAVAVVDLVDGEARGAWTNSGRPPAAEDQLYLQHPGELVEAPPSIRDQVLQATWLPADDQACDAGSWVVAAEAP